MHLIRKEHSFRYLVIRALIALVLVVGGLLFLRFSGMNRWERDLPVEAVEQTMGYPESAPAEDGLPEALS